MNYGAKLINMIGKFILRMLSCLILNRASRKIFRQKYINILDKNLIEKRIKFQNENSEMEFEANFNQKGYKILHYTTYKAQCGISTFTDDLIYGMQINGNNHHAIYPVKFEYLEDIRLIYGYLNKKIDNCEMFDLILIEHEYAFWTCKNIYHNADLINNLNDLYKKYNFNARSYSLVLLDYFIERLLLKNKKVSIIWHTDFKLALCPLFEMNKEIKNYKQIPFFRFLNNNNLKITVMNTLMKKDLQSFNIPADNVNCCFHPVNKKKIMLQAYREDKVLKKEIILGGFGFINEKKGIHMLLKAFLHLPPDFRYIHIGGVHPRGNKKYMDSLKDFTDRNNLKDRVIFTGFLDFDLIDEYLKNIDIGIYLALSKNVYASGAINQFLIRGIPVIASNASDFADLKEAYDCLEIFEDFENEKKLADKIIEFSRDKKRLNILKKNCMLFCGENSFSEFANMIVANQFSSEGASKVF